MVERVVSRLKALSSSPSNTHAHTQRDTHMSTHNTDIHTVMYAEAVCLFSDHPNLK